MHQSKTVAFVLGVFFMIITLPLVAARQDIQSVMFSNPSAPPPVETKLPVAEIAAGDFFGQDVAIDGHYAVVGAPFDDNEKGEDAGAAYVYNFQDDIWAPMARLMADDGAAGELFGYSVAIDGEYLAVGAVWDNEDGEKAGAVYIFHRESGHWTQQAKLTPHDAKADKRFGIDVALKGDRLIVGAFLTTTPGLAPVRPMFLSAAARYGRSRPS